FAGDFTGDSLRKFTQAAVVNQNRELGLPKHVDEPRRNNSSRGVNQLLRLYAIQFADCRDAVAADSDVGGVPWTASAVENVAVLYNGVEWLDLAWRCGINRRRNFAQRRYEDQNACKQNGL